MKIGIDARFFGTEHTGLGRYTQNVLLPLTRHLKDYQLVVYLRDPYYQKLKFGRHVTKVRCNLPHYSLAEQLFLPGMIRNERLDLWFSFHFLIPVFSRVPQIVVIHDLIKTYSRGPETTTHTPWLYQFKRWGYQLTMKQAVTASVAIIVPTNTVKNALLRLYSVRPEKISVISEALDLSLQQKYSDKSLSIFSDLKQYLLYVGNAYPHKNLACLFAALTHLPSHLSLVLVSSPTPHLSRLLSSLSPAVKKRIVLFSHLPDSSLAVLYRRASALVAPSVMEGFGLPGLESLAVGTPVIASDIPVFREVYSRRATYFSPHSPVALASAVKQVLARPRPRPWRYPHTWIQISQTIGEVVDASCARL